MTGPVIRTAPPSDARWWFQAACADLWHLFDSTHPADMRAARDLCNACSVKDACLEDALTREAEPGAVRYGIRGGLDEDQRARAARGRPVNPPPIKHGTYSGWGAHRRRDIPMCEPCLEAQRVYQREKRARAKAREKASA